MQDFMAPPLVDSSALRDLVPCNEGQPPPPPLFLHLSQSGECRGGSNADQSQIRAC